MSTVKRTYHPRNDFVLCRLVQRKSTDGGLVLPENNRGAKNVLVEEIGKDVVGLEKGDQVLVIGKSDDINCYPLPFDNDLFCVRQTDIALVVKENNE